MSTTGTDNQFGQSMLDEEATEMKEFFSKAIDDGYTSGRIGSSPWIQDERMVRIMVAIQDDAHFRIRFTPKSRHDGPTLRGLPKEENLSHEGFEKWVNQFQVNLTESRALAEVLESEKKL